MRRLVLACMPANRLHLVPCVYSTPREHCPDPIKTPAGWASGDDVSARARRQRAPWQGRPGTRLTLRALLWPAAAAPAGALLVAQPPSLVLTGPVVSPAADLLRSVPPCAAEQHLSKARTASPSRLPSSHSLPKPSSKRSKIRLMQR